MTVRMEDLNSLAKLVTERHGDSAELYINDIIETLRQHNDKPAMALWQKIAAVHYFQLHG